MIGTFSKGILKRRLLPTALVGNLSDCRKRSNTASFSAVIGWGLKDNTRKAREFAYRHDIPYLTLEDGFIRSIGLGVCGAEPFGFIIDKIGIYYNAHQASDLENLIKNSTATNPALAAKLIKQLVRIRASKYNHVWQTPTLPNDERPNILLIDQTIGDLSVEFGLADGSSFHTMVNIAMQRYPNGRFFVKSHPDVVAGKKKGYLTGILPDGVNLITEDCNPIELLRQVDHVYTVTSQMGFEALLVGKDVTCFGMPFYAGWGLTEDMIDCQRRNVKRSLEHIFEAAYLGYVRYVDPITEERCNLARILDLIENHKHVVRRNIGSVYCFNFRWWKRGIIQRFLDSERADIIFPNSRSNKYKKDMNSSSRIVVWGVNDNRRIQSLAKRHHISVERIEDGFIRSVGLGSDFARPTSLILDRKGIYFDPRKPSDLENMLNSAQLDDEALYRAERLRQMIVSNGISKYNTGCCGLPPCSHTQKTIILVPGQVEDDASILTGCQDIKTNLGLLREVRVANPEAYIIFKPHPDVVAGNRVGAIPGEIAKPLCDSIVTDCDIKLCLEQADQVHTMTSLTGFEALLRGKQVHTYGLPFYAGWGLTEDRHTIGRRHKKCSIEELLYCSLVLYPRYYHWDAQIFVSIEDAIDSLLRSKNAMVENQGASWWRRLNRKSSFLYENFKLLFNLGSH